MTGDVFAGALVLHRAEAAAQAGDWWLLYPGRYGPFAAMWDGRGWRYAAFGDIGSAVVATRIAGADAGLERRGPPMRAEAEPDTADTLLDAARMVIFQIDQGGTGGKVFARDNCIARLRSQVAKFEDEAGHDAG